MLQKQEISLNLTTGIDTKTDSKLVENNLLTLENAEISNGVIVKSSGYDSLDPMYTSNNLTSNKALIPINDTVGLVEDDKLSIYNTSSSEFSYIDSFGSCGKSVVTIETNIQDKSTPLIYASIVRTLASGESQDYVVSVSSYYSLYSNGEFSTYIKYLITIIEKSTMTVIKKFETLSSYRTFTNSQPIGVVCSTDYFAMYSYVKGNDGYDTIVENVYNYVSEKPIYKDVVIFRHIFSNNRTYYLLETTNIGDTAYIAFNVEADTSLDIVPAFTVRNFVTQTTIVSAKKFNELNFTIPSLQDETPYSLSIRIFNIPSRGKMVAVNAGKTFALLNPTNAFDIWKSFKYIDVPEMPVVAIGYLSFYNQFVVLRSYKTEPNQTDGRKRIPVINKYNLTTDTWDFSGDISRVKYVTINGVTTQQVSNQFAYDANNQSGVCFALNHLVCTDKKAYYIQRYEPRVGISETTPAYPTGANNFPVASDFTPDYEVRSSLFLLDSDYNVCDRFVDYDAATFYTGNTIGIIYSYNSGDSGLNFCSISYPLINKLLRKSSESGGTTKYSYDIKLYRLSYETNYPLRTNKINNGTIVSSPSFMELNNNQLTENNFYDFPQVVVKASKSTGALKGSYTVKVIYEHTNGSGNIVRSAESIAKQISFAQPVSNLIVAFTAPPWFSKRTNQKIKIYCTQANGNAFNLIGELYQVMRPVTVDNDYVSTWVWAPEFTVQTATQVKALIFTDADIKKAVSKEIIYTSGGVLPAFPLPSSITSVTHNNRIFCVPHTNKNLIRYTKPIQVGIATESFIGLDVLIESKGGDIIELSSLDEKLIVFKKSSIYGIQGDGADALGGGTSFGIPYLINSPVGCSEPLSVVRISNGIMFKSTKGIYLLDRSLSVSYIGAPVEKFNNEKINSSVILESDNKVKFTTNAGNVLTYDYFYGVWYTESNLPFLSTSLIKGRFCGVLNTGNVWLNNPNSYLRAGNTYSMKVQTAWLKLKGIQGYSRAYRMYLLGDYKDSHSLNIDVCYDYNENVAHTVNCTPISTGQTFQSRVNFERQKCESLRITFTDVPTGATGNSLTLTDLSILAGVKNGFNKVLPTQTTSV